MICVLDYGACIRKDKGCILADNIFLVFDFRKVNPLAFAFPTDLELDA